MWCGFLACFAICSLTQAFIFYIANLADYVDNGAHQVCGLDSWSYVQSQSHQASWNLTDAKIAINKLFRANSSFYFFMVSRAHTPRGLKQRLASIYSGQVLEPPRVHDAPERQVYGGKQYSTFSQPVIEKSLSTRAVPGYTEAKPPANSHSFGKRFCTKLHASQNPVLPQSRQKYCRTPLS